MTITLPSGLDDLKWMVGIAFPEADEDALWRLAGSWRSAGAAVRGLSPEAVRAGNAVADAMVDDAGRAFTQLWERIASGPESYVSSLAEACDELARICDHMATEVEYAKVQYILALVVLAATIAWLLATTVLGGVSAAGIPVAVAAAQVTIRTVIVRLLTAAAAGAGLNVILDGLVQAGQSLRGHREDWDWAKTGQAAEAGAIFGAAGGGAFLGIGRFAPGLLRSPAGRLATAASASAAAGAAVPLADGTLPTGNEVLTALTSGAFGALGPDRPGGPHRSSTLDIHLPAELRGWNGDALVDLTADVSRLGADPALDATGIDSAGADTRLGSVNGEGAPGLGTLPRPSADIGTGMSGVATVESGRSAVAGLAHAVEAATDPAVTGPARHAPVDGVVLASDAGDRSAAATAATSIAASGPRGREEGGIQPPTAAMDRTLPPSAAVAVSVVPHSADLTSSRPMTAPSRDAPGAGSTPPISTPPISTPPVSPVAGTTRSAYQGAPGPTAPAWAASATATSAPWGRVGGSHPPGAARLDAGLDEPASSRPAGGGDPAGGDPAGGDSAGGESGGGESGGGDPAPPLGPFGPDGLLSDAQAIDLVRGHAFATDAGVAFYPAGDEVRLFAAAVHPTAGYVTLDLHGSPRGFHIDDRRLSPEQFALALRRLIDDGTLVLPEGAGIKLLSCDTATGGADSPAARLARALGVEVIAPDQPIWTALDGQEIVASPVAFGGAFVPKYPPDGQWHRFDAAGMDVGLDFDPGYHGDTVQSLLDGRGPGNERGFVPRGPDGHIDIDAIARLDPEALLGRDPAQIMVAIPENWPRRPSRGGGGLVFEDPWRRGGQIRIMPGYPPGSRADPLTWGPYAVITRNGERIKVPLMGNPIMAGDT